MAIVKIPKGTKDILPPESVRWQDFFIYLTEFFSKYSYEYLITPTMEHTELFTASVGLNTDIVTKEMYTFIDKGGESVTLRPEGTSPVMRAYLAQDERANDLKKYWYFGPMFRYERPQKGRYREFYQFGVETIGTSSPYHDAEQIYMLYKLYQSLGIKVKVVLNSLGCRECSPQYRENLKSYYETKKDKLCNDCKIRVDKNILRVLDCKIETCEIVKQDAPKLSESLCETCDTHFNTVKSLLESLEIPFTVDFKLVRGLDYYNRTVFEFVSDEFGKDKALGGGGRYDYLSRKFIKKDVPAVGFAGGVERTLSMAKDIPVQNIKTLYFALIDEKAYTKIDKLFILKNTLKNIKIIDAGYKVRNLKKHLNRALKDNVDFVLILGEDELNKNEFIIKDMNMRKEHKVSFDNINSIINILF